VLWKEEVNYHMRKNGDKILKTVEAWARDEQNGGMDHGRMARQMTTMSTHGFHGGTDFNLATVLPELQKLLQKYGATHVPERFAPASRQQAPYDGRRPYGRGDMLDGLGGSGFGDGFKSKFGHRW
jgi:hypothetical protein